MSFFFLYNLSFYSAFIPFFVPRKKKKWAEKWEAKAEYVSVEHRQQRARIATGVSAPKIKA